MNIYQNPYDAEKIEAAHKLLAEFDYEVKPLDKGYTHQTLHINVGENKITTKPVSDDMKKTFTGGRGFNMKLLWDAVNENTKWDSPENEIVIAAGPMGGITQYPGTGKSIVCGISPLTGAPVDSNVGGYFGPYLKFSGWDAIEVQGIADKDCIVYINGDIGKIQIFEAPLEDVNSHLIGEQMCDIFADNELDMKSIATVSAGTAAEHSFYGCLNFSFYDRRRKVARLKQAGRGGLGTLLRHKNIKALVCKFSGLHANSNNVADMETIKDISKKYHKEMHDLDDEQCDMRHVGTVHLVELMNDYDLLPTHNYKFGADKRADRISSHVYREMFTQGIPDGCWYGCTMQCAKCVDGHILKTGPYKGDTVSIDGPEYETAAAFGSNMGVFDPHFIVEANFYCDTYGIDTISWGTGMAFVMECFEHGIINKEVTGGYDLSFGKGEESMEMLHQMARGEGFGKVIGLGIRRLKKLFVEKYGADPAFLFDIGMECKGMEYSEYITKESLAMQGGYGLALKGAQHDEAWLIFMDMVNNQIPTFEDKAEALHYFPMFRTWFGLQGLCKLPWNDIEPANNGEHEEPAKVPEHRDNYIDIHNAITGNNIDEKEMILQSERVYNFQRVFNLRLGFGTREHDMIPYRSAGPVTNEEYLSREDRYDTQLKEKYSWDPTGKTLDERRIKMREFREKDYQSLCDVVYKRRGWDNNGVPTIEKVKELGIAYPGILDVLNKYYN